MEFDNSFEVPLPPDRAWKTLMDVESIAPCMPGAELTEIVDEKTFKGKVSVRLGPVALTFQGQAAFEEIDDAAKTATVKAQGSDAKGRGGAQANVGFSLEPSDAGSTVNIHTDLQLSGSVAQYGRGAGMIQDLAGQIIGQFAKNLSQQIESGALGTGDEASVQGAPAAAPASGVHEMEAPDTPAAAAPARPDPDAPAAAGGAGTVSSQGAPAAAPPEGVREMEPPTPPAADAHATPDPDAPPAQAGAAKPKTQGAPPAQVGGMAFRAMWNAFVGWLRGLFGGK